MSIKYFRFFMIFVFLLIILSGNKALFYYWPLLFISLEFLNRKQLYLNRAYKTLNLFYLLYIAFITTERGRNQYLELLSGEKRIINLGGLGEMILNIAEHLAFAIVVCSQLFFYIVIFSKKISNTIFLNIRILMVFNLLGIVNEVFQNFIDGRQLFVFLPDATKDIFVNVAGSIIYFLAAYYYEDERKIPA